MPDAQPHTARPDTWLPRFGDYLYSYARLKVGNTAAAEDLVQETLLAAFRSVESFQGQSSEKTWLVAILRNKIIDHYRKRDALKDTATYLADTQSEFDSPFFESPSGHWQRPSRPLPWTPPADDHLHQQEFEQVLHQCIQKLPARIVPVFIAKFIDEEDSDTICKVYNLSPSNYWVILHRSKVLLRACLDKNWFHTDQPA
ncbi:MAG: sigma-70 family RNA polymerase sigma factor [Cyclobacteriaceae bacterium]|nr:sigma-70 family RNA polymerase sigma factor [Cyclobacteriaceae bacterium]